MTSSSSAAGERGSGPGDEERLDFFRGADLAAGRFLFLDLDGASESSETTKSSKSSEAGYQLVLVSQSGGISTIIIRGIVGFGLVSLLLIVIENSSTRAAFCCPPSLDRGKNGIVVFVRGFGVVYDFLRLRNHVRKLEHWQGWLASYVLFETGCCATLTLH